MPYSLALENFGILSFISFLGGRLTTAVDFRYELSYSINVLFMCEFYKTQNL